jgi:hypothetical protein
MTLPALHFQKRGLSIAILTLWRLQVMRMPVHIIGERIRRERERQRRQEEQQRLPLSPPEQERRENDGMKEKRSGRRIIVIQM